MNPYKMVFFDIVNYCNAKCSYCITGRDTASSKNTISPDVFKTVLNKLLKQNAIDSSSVIGLYNWAEPFLHPNFDGIVEVINSVGLKYAISTNASVIPKITKEMARNLYRLIITVHGFSQKSYDRVCKLNFEIVRENIIRMVRDYRTAGYKGDISMTYLVYQFNLHEIWLCEKFAKRLRVNFKPCYAIINDWYLLNGWLNNSLSNDEMRRISEDIFCFEIRDKIKSSPKDYRCPQLDYLVINENADIVLCCQVPKYEPKFLCGNILQESMEDILEQREKSLVCVECKNFGLSYYINNSLVCPEFYKKWAVTQHSYFFKAPFRYVRRIIE